MGKTNKGAKARALRYIQSDDLQQRWWVCMRIAKKIYTTELTNENIEKVDEVFKDQNVVRDLLTKIL
jgi:L-rhamnose mutarotase